MRKCSFLCSCTKVTQLHVLQYSFLHICNKAIEVSAGMSVTEPGWLHFDACLYLC